MNGEEGKGNFSIQNPQITINMAHRQDIFGLNEKVLVLHQTTLLDAILFKNTFHPSQLKIKHITIQSIH